MADSIAVAQFGVLPFTSVSEHVDEFVTVGEVSIALAITMLVEHSKQTVEQAGAVGITALIEGIIDVSAARHTGVVHVRGFVN